MPRIKSAYWEKQRKKERQKQAAKVPRRSKRYKTIKVTKGCSLSCQMQKMGLGSYSSPWNLRKNKTNPKLDSLYKGNRKMFNVSFPSNRK